MRAARSAPAGRSRLAGRDRGATTGRVAEEAGHVSPDVTEETGRDRDVTETLST